MNNAGAGLLALAISLQPFSGVHVMKKFAKLAVAAALAGLAVVAQAGYVIDDFNTGNLALQDKTSGTQGWSGSGAGTMVGGFRDMWVNKITNDLDPIGTSAGKATNAEVGGGSFGFSNGTGTAGEAIVRWDGSTAASFADNQTRAQFDLTRTYGLSLDLTTLGNAFKFTVIQSDADFEFTLALFTSATDWTAVTLTAGANINPADHSVDFGLFLLPDGSTIPNIGTVVQHGAGVNLFNVTAMEAIINDSVPGIYTDGRLVPSRNIDLSIDQVETVPEPGSLALTSLALLGLVGAIRRRKSV